MQFTLEKELQQKKPIYWLFLLTTNPREVKILGRYGNSLLFPGGLSLSTLPQLSRRERQIMDAVYSKGEATATDVLETIPDPPTRTALRTLLRILEAKGHLMHLTHVKRGREFVYQPTHSRDSAGKSAFERAIRTFFDGSLEKAVAAYLGDPKAEVPPDELRRLSALIKRARSKEKEP